MSSINPLEVQSQIVQPRGQVIVNGIALDWLTLEVDNNNFYVADTFKVDFAANNLGVKNINTFIDANPLLVNVLIGFPDPSNTVTSNGMTSFILGQVDSLDYDPFNQIITINGRDLTSRFIDNKTSEKFMNQTSSQIATLLANRRGLTAAITSTTTLVGDYYKADHSRITREISEWDLLTYLARAENFDVFVSENTLYFGPPINNNIYNMPFKMAKYGLTLPNANVIDVQFSHNKTLANDVKVTVQSWNIAQSATITETATATHQKGARFGSSANNGLPQNYTYVFPNLTKDQAKQKAQQLAQDITAHELRLMSTLPGDNNLNKKSLINVTGTGTIFDAQYYVDTVIRKLSFDGGYEMTVKAKNHSPMTQVVL